MVVIPTRHLYGLAVDARDTAALRNVYALKGRPADKPLLILVKSRADVADLVVSIPDAARRLMDSFWPGGLTLVLEAREFLPSILTGGTAKVGIRLPAHPVCQSLLAKLSHPITATSANRSGQPGCHRVADLPADLQAAVDIILDAGPLPPGVGSTVVDATISPPRILRAGALDAQQIADVLG